MPKEVLIAIETDLYTLMAPKTGEPVATRFEISSDGKMSYRENGYKNNPIDFRTDEEEVIRSIRKELSPETYHHISKAVNKAMNSRDEIVLCADCGEYSIEIIYDNGTRLTKEGCLLEPVRVGGKQLNKILEELTGIEKMYVGRLLITEDEVEEEIC